MRYGGRAAAALAAVAFGLVLALAACGGEDEAGVPRLGDGGTTTATQQASRDFEDAALDYARCMRENGVEMPDPERGRFVITPETDPSQHDQATFREADSRCRKHLDNAKPPELTEEQKQEFERAALEHARCMREHGIDFPDPAIREGGGAAVSLDGIDLDDPKFQAAQKACEGKLRAVQDELTGGGSDG